MTEAVIVVGAGYAGVIAANRIATGARDAARVTVINPRADFVERIRLHQYAVDSGSARIELRTLLDDRVRLVLGTVTKIDDGSVELADGARLPYDRLVYAVGSAGAVPVVPGPLFRLDDVDQAERTRTALAVLTGGTVTFVGGGLTGIEAAAEAAGARPDLRIRLISQGELAASLRPAERARMRASLRRQGVEVIEGQRVTAVTERAVITGTGSHPTDLAIWSGSFGVPELARRSGLPVDRAGRLIVDETLTSTGDRRIVGAGDAIAAPASVGFVRMSCQAALPLGRAAAGTVLARLRDRTPDPVTISYVLQCVSLGRSDGAVHAVGHDDRSRGVSFGGLAAAWVKERICRFTVRTMRGTIDRPSRAGATERIAA
ncbi:NAD(P)/FAD-dependent oxidoreductase [Microlunatus speluncae]|uniref:NAD(P)/FAD-dependent oxidoreductase n=1 Tax=Microlunatus speluncae TaxID=2594267 RepID=UPI0012667204|nr:FAD-dependent oxidoreductase [Microlunatus speluncae]